MFLESVFLKEKLMENYSLSKRYGFYFKGLLTLWCLFALGICLFIWIRGGLLFVIPMLIFYIVIAILFYNAYQNVNIRITETEITYSAFGITIEADWKNTEDIRNVRTPVMYMKQDCIIVDPSNLKIISTSALGPFILPYAINSDPQKAIIPLSQFQDHWRERDLGLFIKKYAPHLLVTSETAAVLGGGSDFTENNKGMA